MRAAQRGSALRRAAGSLIRFGRLRGDSLRGYDEPFQFHENTRVDKLANVDLDWCFTALSHRPICTAD